MDSHYRIFMTSCSLFCCCYSYDCGCGEWHLAKSTLKDGEDLFSHIGWCNWMDLDLFLCKNFEVVLRRCSQSIWLGHNWWSITKLTKLSFYSDEAELRKRYSCILRKGTNAFLLKVVGFSSVYYTVYTRLPKHSFQRNSIIDLSNARLSKESSIFVSFPNFQKNLFSHESISLLLSIFFSSLK